MWTYLNDQCHLIFNPIEHFWDEIEPRICVSCKIKLETWSTTPVKTLLNLIESMRLQAVLQNNGGQTKYLKLKHW